MHLLDRSQDSSISRASIVSKRQADEHGRVFHGCSYLANEVKALHNAVLLKVYETSDLEVTVFDNQVMKKALQKVVTRRCATKKKQRKRRAPQKGNVASMTS